MKISPLNEEYFEEFISENNLDMVKGYNMDWRKNYTYRDNIGPIYLNVTFEYYKSDGKNGIINANYFIKDRIIKFAQWFSGGSGTIDFKVKNLKHAEELVLMSMKSYKGKLSLLYSKDEN